MRVTTDRFLRLTAVAVRTIEAMGMTTVLPSAVVLAVLRWVLTTTAFLTTEVAVRMTVGFLQCAAVAEVGVCLSIATDHQSTRTHRQSEEGDHATMTIVVVLAPVVAAAVVGVFHRGATRTGPVHLHGVTPIAVLLHVVLLYLLGVLATPKREAHRLHAVVVVVVTTTVVHRLSVTATLTGAQQGRGTLREGHRQIVTAEALLRDAMRRDDTTRRGVARLG
jgi:hypothetical protein